VLKKGAKAEITVPHWASARYYGDPTHKEPFSEFAWLYLNAEWRKANAPHVGYVCDFDSAYGFSIRPTWAISPGTRLRAHTTEVARTCGDHQKITDGDRHRQRWRVRCRRSPA
jgi:hypothetical protein